MIRRLAAQSLLVAVAAILGAWSPAAAQATRCNLEGQDATRQSLYQLPSGNYNQFLGGGLRIRCPDRQIVLTADSAEMWGDESRIFLVGRVRYVEARRMTLDADFLTYYQLEERVNATGNVKASLPTGSKLEGPQATYLRYAPAIRPRQQLSAFAGPTVTIIERDSAGRAAAPLIVRANSILMDGDSLVYASTQVDIVRDSLHATGDSAFVDSGAETFRLMRNPVIVGGAERRYTLKGDLIDAYSRNRQLQRIVSRGGASVTSEELTITADTIELAVNRDLLDRAIAWSHATPARAVAPSQTIVADSIDVVMPGQQVRRVVAIRRAYADAVADSVRFETTERDWLRGDTVIAVFDSVAAKDTSQGPPLRRLTATSDSTLAAAYYQLAAADSTIRIPAISYVRGRRIDMRLGENGMEMVTVTDSVAGLYVEPVRDSTGVVRAASPPPGVAPAGNTSRPIVPPPGTRPPAIPFDRRPLFHP